MKKRIISLLMALVMVIGLVPLTSIEVSAASTTASGKTCYYAGETVSLSNLKAGDFLQVDVKITYSGDFPLAIKSGSASTPLFSGGSLPTTIGDLFSGSVTATSGFWKVEERGDYDIKLINEKPSFSITFKNHDGTVLQKSQWGYGAIPSYSGTPTKASDAQYTYTFKGWNPAISAAKGNKTYTATYDSNVNMYTVKFQNEDGTVLQNSQWKYGTTPSYTGVTPTKASDERYHYTFAGWNSTISTVTSNKTYTATYTPSDRYYNISLTTAPGGTCSVDKTTAIRGETVTMTVAPKLGYYIHEVKVNDTVLTAVSEGNYSFAMPAKDVTVSVFFDFDFTAIADELQVLNDADDALEAASAALNSAVANKADIATLNAMVAELQNAIAVAEAAAKAYTDAKNTDLVTELEKKLPRQNPKRFLLQKPL